jgi:hypothetical protein
MKPSNDPEADELRNKNLSEPKGGKQDPNVSKEIAKKGADQNG